MKSRFLGGVAILACGRADHRRHRGGGATRAVSSRSWSMPGPQSANRRQTLNRRRSRGRAIIGSASIHDGLTREYLVHVPQSYRGRADADAARAARRRRRCRLPGRRFEVQADLQVGSRGFHRRIPQRLSRAPERGPRDMERRHVLRRGAEEQRRRRRFHPRGNRRRRAPGEHRPEPRVRDRHVKRRDDDVAARLRSA